MVPSTKTLARILPRRFPAALPFSHNHPNSHIQEDFGTVRCRLQHGDSRYAHRSLHDRRRNQPDSACRSAFRILHAAAHASVQPQRNAYLFATSPQYRHGRIFPRVVCSGLGAPGHIPCPAFRLLPARDPAESSSAAARQRRPTARSLRQARTTRPASTNHRNLFTYQDDLADQPRDSSDQRRRMVSAASGQRGQRFATTWAGDVRKLDDLPSRDRAPTVSSRAATHGTGLEKFIRRVVRRGFHRVRRNLTLEAGLRQEFTTGWNEANGRAANYVIECARTCW